MRTVQLYAYRFSAEAFHPFTEPEPARRGGPAEPSALVAPVSVRPLGPPERVGDLFALHEAAGIELRVLPQLRALWTAVTASTLGFSGIRLSNAARPEHPARPPPTASTGIAESGLEADGHIQRHGAGSVEPPGQPRHGRCV
jgi:hypothetical protein